LTVQLQNGVAAARVLAGITNGIATDKRSASF